MKASVLLPVRKEITMKRTEESYEKKTLVGIGLDNDDGQTRISRGKNFALLGGSEETHALMQETAIKVNEQLTKRGETMNSVRPEELGEIVREVAEKIKK